MRIADAANLRPPTAAGTAGGGVLALCLAGDPRGNEWLYVGRTGDASSPHASAPFKRLGQHLSYNAKQNPLRRYLEARGIDPEACDDFEFIACGPIHPKLPPVEGEGRDAKMARHRPFRDSIGALEARLAAALAEAGYQVLNKVTSRKTLDPDLWENTRQSFVVHFPRLMREEG